MEESIKTLIKLGYSEKDANDLVNEYALCNLKDETLKNNIISVYNYLLSLGYAKTDIIKMAKIFPALYSLSKENIQDKIDFLISLGYTKKDVIKMTKLLPNLYGLSKENIRDKIDFLISLGYTKKDAIKMTKQISSLYSLSKENIRDKMNFLISLGYTKEDVIKMTKLLPALYGYSKDNIRDKIEYLKSVKLEFIVLFNPKYLMQSTKLTYARYKFLTEEKNNCISKENYKKLFISNKQFENVYGISKQELLERYPYEKREKENDRLLIKVRN